ncbi:hypothetical protein Gotri_004193 [Gossypium trilobum]|uniref:Uncharacterized protein n=1 Tax=Gossypium trilobum TaxID=34281 RepID=A0A7J9F450_9ROSI|nr:hypothetical protein [Gossypium trilobum]
MIHHRSFDLFHYTAREIRFVVVASIFLITMSGKSDSPSQLQYVPLHCQGSSTAPLRK